MPYQFTGCAPFVDAAADTLGLTNARLRALARGQAPVSRVQSALGQASSAKPDQRAAILAEAEKWRSIAAVMLKGIDAAIADAKAGLGLAEPEPPKSTPAPTPPLRRSR